MDILFKSWVKATEQMTQNRTIRNPRINESAKSQLTDMYVVLVSCFHSILHLKTWTKGSYALNLRLLLFFDMVRMYLKIYKRNVSSASFRPIYTVNGCCFWVSFRQKNDFCVRVQVDVHEMAKIRKVLCKQYVSTKKNIEVPKHFMAILRTLVIALLCLFAVAQSRYLPSIKGYSQHYEICTLLKMAPRKEIKLCS